MKQLITLTICLFSLFGVAKADEDKPIKFNELPEKAQSFIKKHFSVDSISYAKMEDDFWSKSYDVIFVNGDKIEFDKNGKWKKIDCEYSQVPQATIPKPILDYLSKQYPKCKVLQIERDRYGYEIELSNDLQIKFNPKFQVIEIDR